MIINFWLLPLTLLLLWFPRQWFRFGLRFSWANGSRRRKRAKDRDDRDTGDASMRFGEVFFKPRNWFDFFRALIGAIALVYFCFDSAPEATRETLHQIRWIKAFILVIGVLIQTVRLENRLTLVAPVFYILGSSFGMIDWRAALFATIAVWTINLVLPSAGVFLFVFAGLQVCFGLLLQRGAFTEVSIAAGITCIPIVLSALTKRRLVQLNKKTKSGRSTSVL